MATRTVLSCDLCQTTDKQGQFLTITVNLPDPDKHICAECVRKILQRCKTPDKSNNCGVQGQDLECVECSVRIYGRKIEDVCRKSHRTVAEVNAAKNSPGGCCDKNADMSGCDCLDKARKYEGLIS